MLNLPGKIPISIHPLFWLTAAAIGWLNSNSFSGIIGWIFIILVSVLVHEFGHALAARIFGQKPKITLIALGGLTSYEGGKLKFWQQFLVVFMGPLFGLLLFLFSFLLLKLQLFENAQIISVLTLFAFVNLFWSIVNLFPVLPLDGGQLLRIALEGFFGLKGFKLSMLIGTILAFSISLFFFLVRYYLIGALFFLFAFQGFDAWRRTKFFSEADREEDNAKKLSEGEKALQEGHKSEAKKIFEDLRKITSKGIIYTAATNYLAVLEYEEGEKQQAYTYLLSVKDNLDEEALCLLHELAFDEKNYPLVANLSAACYQNHPLKEIALRNARAFAFLKQAKPAGGWLQTALGEGKEDIEKILSESIFEDIKDDPAFKRFFE